MNLRLLTLALAGLIAASPVDLQERQCTSNSTPKNLLLSPILQFISNLHIQCPALAMSFAMALASLSLSSLPAPPPNRVCWCVPCTLHHLSIPYLTLMTGNFHWPCCLQWYKGCPVWSGCLPGCRTRLYGRSGIKRPTWKYLPGCHQRSDRPLRTSCAKVPGYPDRCWRI